MATSLQATLSILLSGGIVDTLDVGEVSYPLALNLVNNFANGSGANQANKVFTDTRTLSASGTESLDLAGGLTDAFGVTLTFTKIKAIIVTAAAGNTNSVQVTRPASNGLPLFMAAGDGIPLTPDAVFAAVFPNADGVAVTAGTGDLLTFTNSAGSTSVTYTIVVVGVV
jgi:hypothetical protein